MIKPTKKTYLKNYVHPKLVRLAQKPTYTKSGEIDDYYSFFSEAPCDCCGSFLAGDRYECDPCIDTKDHPLTQQVIYACLDCVIKFQ